MSELHLRVYATRSELILPDGTVQAFQEGGMNQAAKTRYKKIAVELSNGYLESRILACRDESSNLDFSELRQTDKKPFEQIGSVSNREVGRGVSWADNTTVMR
jgi:hypothetical protein